VLSAFALNASAANLVTTVNVSLDQHIEAPRWMYDGKLKVKGGSLIELMVDAKKGLAAKDRARCLSNLQKAYGQGKSLAPWIAWNQLQCAQLKDKKGDISAPALAQAVEKVDAQPKWLLFGPSAQPLRVAYVGALLALTEYQTKTDRSAAWKNVNKLQQIHNWLNADERANIYRWAGELAFVEQNLLAAQDFMQRSLGEKENAELREKVESIRSSLLGAKRTAVSAPPAPPKANEDIGISDEEKEIYARLSRSIDAQDYVSAIEDGVELILKFPGSRRAIEASDKVLDIYLSVSSRTEEKFKHVRDTIVHTMLKADAGRLARWANSAYQRGNYLDALNLADKSYSKYSGHPESTKILLLAGKAAIASGEQGDAVNDLERLARQHGGTPEAAEAIFRLGLLQFRNKRYAQASGYFERLLAITSNKDYEYRALYWQWRAHQKTDPEKSAPYAEPLITKYPLTYYGLRAKAELNKGELELPNASVTAKAELHFLETDRLAWERVIMLLKAGWFKEAEKEFESLPEPQSVDERLVRAKLWALAMRYDLAVSHLNKAFDESPELQQISVLKLVYPHEYDSWISRESKSLGLGADWIRSLIRQESSFRADAKSSSGALGVMQLLPMTGQELAHDFKIKNFSLPDGLVDPDLNIRLGSNYLSRMIHNFSGNVPLALAAYNAGPTRLRRWLSARKDLTPLENSQSSAPEVELWIDELPWDETSFYVKAVLRNWLIYRLLDGSKLSLTEPIWLDAKPAPR
jgi:soluble lytic murein transglycosylase